MVGSGAWGEFEVLILSSGFEEDGKPLVDHLLRHAANFNDLPRTGVALADDDRTRLNIQGLGDQEDDRLVGLALFRRRRDLDLQGIAVAAHDAVAPGAGDDLEP